MLPIWVTQLWAQEMDLKGKILAGKGRVCWGRATARTGGMLRSLSPLQLHHSQAWCVLPVRKAQHLPFPLRPSRSLHNPQGGRTAAAEHIAQPAPHHTWRSLTLGWWWGASPPACIAWTAGSVRHGWLLGCWKDCGFFSCYTK